MGVRISCKGTKMNLESFATRVQQTVEPVLVDLLKPRNLAKIVSKLPAKLNISVIQRILNSAFEEQILDGDFG